MSVLAFLGQFPGAARRVISISGTAAASPFAIALRSIQREAILRDPDWAGGGYTNEKPPATGMRIARKLGMMTYRSAHEWVQRFGREPVSPDLREDGPFAPEFAIQSYLEAHARRFVRAFDPNCYLYISRGMDRFDLAKHGGTNVEALKRSRVEQRARDRRGVGHAVRDRRAALRWRKISRTPASRRVSRRSIASRGTIRSSSTSSGSVRKCGRFWAEERKSSIAGRLGALNRRAAKEGLLQAAQRLGIRAARRLRASYLISPGNKGGSGQ